MGDGRWVVYQKQTLSRADSLFVPVLRTVEYVIETNNATLVFPCATKLIVIVVVTAAILMIAAVVVHPRQHCHRNTKVVVTTAVSFIYVALDVSYVPSFMLGLLKESKNQ